MNTQGTKEQKNEDTCVIWNTKIRDLCKTSKFSQEEEYEFNSPRAGGKYRVSNSLYKRFIDMDSEKRENIFNQQERLVLSGEVAKENLKGNVPFLDSMIRDNKREADDYFLNRLALIPIPNLNPGERAYLLLEGLVRKTDVIGKKFDYDDFLSWYHKSQLTHPYTFFYALSYCSQNNEMEYLLNYLKEMGFIRVTRKSDGSSDFEVTVQGFEKINSISNMESRIAFIAMWFNPSMNDLKKSIQIAVKNAGYEASRIDDIEHLDKIDDQILVRIKEARFIICDLTSEKEKPRGSVYFEAGYAMGKNIPVIWTCNKNKKKRIAFDIRQYNCLFWGEDNMDKFIYQLQHRIENVIGRGLS